MYYTGTANDVDDLLDIVYARATANGFTSVLSPTARPDGLGKYFYLQNSQGSYLAFWSDTTVDEWDHTNPMPGIMVQMYATLDNGVLPWEQSEDGCGVSVTNGMWGPFVAYHIFVESNYLQVVVEVAPRTYCHFGYALHENKWSYVGGESIYGTFWNHSTSYRTAPTSIQHSTPYAGQSVYYRNCTVRCDVEGVSPNYFSNYAYAYQDDTEMLGGYPLGTRATFGTLAYEFSPSTLNGIEQLFPVINGIKRSDKFRLIGSVPNMRSVNITNREHGETIQYGSDEWVVFPMKKKQLTTPEREDLGSDAYGLAYKK